MGMFDTVHNQPPDKADQAEEFQTKAFECVLDRIFLGQPTPILLTPYGENGPPMPAPDTYQVEVMGGRHLDCVDTYATIRDGHLSSVGDPQDMTLPQVDYYGNIVHDPTQN